MHKLLFPALHWNYSHRGTRKHEVISRDADGEQDGATLHRLLIKASNRLSGVETQPNGSEAGHDERDCGLAVSPSGRKCYYAKDDLGSPKEDGL